MQSTMHMPNLKELDRNILSFWKGITQSNLGWNWIKIHTTLFYILDVSVGYVSAGFSEYSLHKKWSFPLRISLVNVTKSEKNCKFGHIYWKNP